MSLDAFDLRNIVHDAQVSLDSLMSRVQAKCDDANAQGLPGLDAPVWLVREARAIASNVLGAVPDPTPEAPTVPDYLRRQALRNTIPCEVSDDILDAILAIATA